MPAKLPQIPDFKSLRFRKTLSIPSLLKKVKTSFNNIKDHRKKKPDYSLVDVLMSGLAIFGLKCPSLLDFETKRKEKNVKHNLHTLYGGNRSETPSPNTCLHSIVVPELPLSNPWNLFR